MVKIIDYGMGNLASIKNMLKKIGARADITSNSGEIENAEKLILPGVGAFDNGMKNIKEKGLFEILNHKAMIDKIPVLGICLGMQLLTDKSEEGNLPGLGWIKGETVKFKFQKLHNGLKIPHMGWNEVWTNRKSELNHNIGDDPRFYFVHSYHVVCPDEDNVVLKTFYGYDFASAIQKENIYGVQFHPEKSHKYGMRLLSNFINIK